MLHIEHELLAVQTKQLFGHGRQLELLLAIK
jgi:hypothetical protein